MTATSTIRGQNTLSCRVNGSLWFTVLPFRSRESSRVGHSASSVVGRVAGIFDSQVSTPMRQVIGGGTAEWTIGGTHDPATETVGIAIRSSGADYKGTDTALGEAAQGTAPVAVPLSMTLNWGWQASKADLIRQTPPPDDPSTILDAMKAPAVPAIPAERQADSHMVNSLPQTGLKEFQRLVIDLKEPKPQTVTQTFQDETGLGTRTTTWTFTLIPRFSIERDDRAADGRYSFVSTDSITLHMAIPGMTVAKSGWANQISWEAKGTGPFSGSGVPNKVPHSAAFSFQPNPGTRPTSGSTVRNRPIQYTVSATSEGSVEFFLLTQDDADLLRQEYIDHNEAVVPSRSDCVAHPIDNSFNVGNYNVAIDGGMQAALDKVTLEFARDSKGSVRVASGFRSPRGTRRPATFTPTTSTPSAGHSTWCRTLQAPTPCWLYTKPASGQAIAASAKPLLASKFP